MTDNIDEMVKMWETLSLIRKHCLKWRDCDECIFQDTVCGNVRPTGWELEILKERIKERW